MWSSYRDDEPDRTEDPEARPGVAPIRRDGIDPVELVVDGERFVVSRRADSSNTYDFDWVSHPESYGFSLSGPADLRMGRAEMITEIRSFLREIDPETGYLPD